MGDYQRRLEEQLSGVPEQETGWQLAKRERILLSTQERLGAGAERCRHRAESVIGMLVKRRE